MSMAAQQISRLKRNKILILTGRDDDLFGQLRYSKIIDPESLQTPMI